MSMTIEDVVKRLEDLYEWVYAGDEDEEIYAKTRINEKLAEIKEMLVNG